MFARKKIVFTAGTWDLFHMGHLNMIRRAKACGDILIVGVSTDELVGSYKDRKSFNSYEERFSIIESLVYVDFVVKQEHLIDIAQMQTLNVDILVLGDDWKNVKLDGIDWMKQNKRVIFLSRTKGVSTSTIKHKLKFGSFI